MASSEVDICNLALTQLREQPITSLTDDASEAAQLCDRLYADARDWVLRAHPWNFAVRRRSLAQVSPGPDFGYVNAFALPADPFCLRVMTVNDPGTYTRYKIEGRQLLTDDGSVNLVYVARVIDVNTYDAGFVQALAAYLAAQLAYPLTANRNLAGERLDIFNDHMRRAKAIDGIEDVHDGTVISPFVAEHLRT